MMITGAVIAFAGLAFGFYGTTNFNLGQMICGWAIALIGVAIFFSHIIPVW